MSNEDRQKEAEADKETLLNSLKEEYNNILQKKNFLMEHEKIIKE